MFGLGLSFKTAGMYAERKISQSFSVWYVFVGGRMSCVRVFSAFYVLEKKQLKTKKRLRESLCEDFHLFNKWAVLTDFVPRLELFSPFRDFWKSMKMCEMNCFSLFCKWYLVLFLTFIIRTPILCCTTTDLGIFWYCSRDFWSCIRESPANEEFIPTSVFMVLFVLLFCAAHHRNVDDDLIFISFHNHESLSAVEIGYTD